ncbi:exo-alpha-sialidase [Devriesea agamarum]|uniref:exo-alpha-sialidase n=1 Tax=Devriesea agamarum TaxID=472569 RepID=UPI000A06BC5E|nr:exo-alpha-sialidase [Devriesea agamarum]
MPEHPADNAPTLIRDVAGDSRSIQAALSDIRDLAENRSGTLLLQISSRIDGPVLVAEGENGELTLAINGGRLSGTVRHSDEHRLLDAEDARGLDDGVTHTLGLTVDHTGTHVIVDGYEAFSATTTAWFADIALTSLRIDPEGIMEPSRLMIWDAPLSPRATVAQCPPVKSFVEFAASALSNRDARRCGKLDDGALRALFRTRGRGQGGTIIAARGIRGMLELAIDNGSLTYRAYQDGEQIADVYAGGQWDDGQWHDVVLVSGRGAVDLYVDGYQVAHVSGTAFFADLGEVERVVVGIDLTGSRLFGEAQTAMIYDLYLSDHQVKRLAGVEPLPTRALFDTGYQSSRSYRIPSLITLDSGVILAGADKRVSIPNDSPNDIDFVMRRSLDGGQTWDEARTLITYPGSGALGSSVIDSVLVQDRKSGRVLVLIDHFPGGIGQPNSSLGTGFADDGRRILHDRAGHAFLLDTDGTVCDADGNPTTYRVDAQGNVTRDGAAAGNIHLAPGVDPNETLLAVPTAYLQMIVSDDDGQTWSDPIDLTSQVKEPWMRFFGTSPGNGIQLQRGEHAGRILVPVYYNHEEGITFSCAAIFSDDGGHTWTRGASPNDGRLLDGVEISSRDLSDDRGSLHESVLVEGSDGEVHVYMRNQHPSGRVAHAVSRDGGQTWGPVDFIDQLTEIFSQPNAVRVTDDAGREAVVFANASKMLPFRGCGVLRLSYDDGQTWPHNRVFNPRHYVYQCMTQLPNGDLALLWERECQGLFLTILPLTWLTQSRSTCS